MKVLTVLAVVVAAVIIFWLEWPRIGKDMAKERATIVVLLCLSLLLSVFRLMFKDAPGPTDLIERLFHSAATRLGL